MYGNFETQAVEQSRDEGYKAGYSKAKQEAEWQRAAMSKLADQIAEKDALIAEKDDVIEQLQRDLLVALQAKMPELQAAARQRADEGAGELEKLKQGQAALAAAQAAFADEQARFAELRTRYEQGVAANTAREKVLIEEYRAFEAEIADSASADEAVAQAAVGDFSFSTASLARMVVLCDQRAAKALALADGYQQGHASDRVVALRQEAQRWMQQSKAASQALGNLPKVKVAKGNVDVRAIVTAPEFIETCHRLASQSPGRHIPCTALLTAILMEMPELRTINNGRPLGIRQIGEGLASLGIRSEPVRVPGSKTTDRCFAASDFILTKDGRSRNAPAIEVLPKARR